VTAAAGRSELRAAAEILDEAASWMAARGFMGWRPGSFRRPGTFERRALVSAFGSGDLYVAWEAERAVATVTLLWEDPLYWPGAPEDAGYVHRLAVRRTAAGRGVGRMVLGWAEEQARARGKQHLRLDCAADDPGIRAYYERARFVHQREVRVRGVDMSLYQKEIFARLSRSPRGDARLRQAETKR
jgi:GNAT superfamily N-acetyltransferase